MTNRLTDEDIAKMVANATIAETDEASPPIPKQKTELTRNIMFIGAGDGGCNIASDIKREIPEVFVIAYNTSKRAMSSLTIDAGIVPNAEDGSGKDRSYSKNVFKRAAYKNLIGLVEKTLAARRFDYIIVTTTADGGTGGGSSPNIAKVIADNVDIPVIVLGVYPAIAEDAKAQYNTIAWQADIEKTGLPYIIYDNQARSNVPKAVMQEAVNKTIVEDMKVLTGVAYGDTTISAIDNRDMHMLLVEAGKRINIISTDMKPKVGETLDEFLTTKLTAACQPLPAGQTAMGLFIKGPKAFISSIDTSLFGFREQFGDALLYTHIEECTDVCISMVIAGSDLPEMRLEQIKERYNDIMANYHVSEKTAASVLDEMSDPFAIKKRVAKTQTEDLDFSGLDL